MLSMFLIQGLKMKNKLYSVALFLSFFVEASDTNWILSDNSSNMSGNVITSASIMSVNEVEFASPYDGKQFAELRLWTSSNATMDYLTFKIDRGQIVCWTGKGCDITIKLDNSNPINLKGSKPTDGTSTYTIIDLNGDLSARIKRTKKILVQPTIYKNGYPIFEFDAKNNPYPCCKQYPILLEVDNIKNGIEPDLIKVGESSEKMPMNQCKWHIPSEVKQKDFGFGEYGVYTKRETNSKLEWVEYGYHKVEKVACQNGMKTTTNYKYKSMTIN